MGGGGGTAEIYCWAQEFLVHPHLGVWGSAALLGGAQGYLDGEKLPGRVSGCSGLPAPDKETQTQGSMEP